VKAGLARFAARGAGVVLIVFILWVVGWQDRVTGTDGVEYTGRIVSRSDETVVLRTDGGERTIAIEDARAVREGLGSSFTRLTHRPALALLGLLVHLVALAATVVRWGVLLHAAQLTTPWRGVFRFGWIGHFFGSVLPGGTAGGDLAKAFYVARDHLGSRTRAVVSVFVDRAVGLGVLCGIAAVAVLFAPQGSRLVVARNLLLALAAVVVAGGLLTFSARVRRWLRLPQLLARLPFQGLVTELREATAIYGQRKSGVLLAVLCALVGHAFFLLAFWLYAGAMGTPLPAMAVFVAIPVAQMLAAVPGLPGGWGVGDFAFFFFLPATGVPAGPAVALSFTFRLAYTLLSTPGGLLLARRKG
jgi:uncharacterized protein (TIRG00374 family)